MKKILFLTLLICAVGCGHHIEYDQNFHITLDEGNTYVVGQPVKFNINGNMDNILFYSGEEGSEYAKKDRYRIPLDQIKSAILTIESQANYKNNQYNDAVHIYVTDQFNGLDWSDGELDRETVAGMLENGMQGWTEIEYVHGKHQSWVTQQFDITDFISNFCIAFRWTPVIGSWDKYLITCSVEIQVEGMTNPIKYTLNDFSPNVLMLSEQHTPYQKGNSVGEINLNSVEYDMGFMGSTSITYPVDGWVFTSPAQIGKIESDHGTIIKTLETYLRSYEYTWDKSGSYKVTFISNDYVAGDARRNVQQFNINIIEDHTSN